MSWLDVPICSVAGVVHPRTNRDLMYRDATRGLRERKHFNAILQMLAPIGARRDSDNYLVAFCQLVMSTSVFFVLQ